MKILKIFLIFVIVSAVVGIGTAYNTPLEAFQSKQTIEQNESKTDVIVEDTITDKIEDDKRVEKENSSKRVEEKSTNGNNSNKQTTEVKTNKSNTSSESKKEEKKNEENSNIKPIEKNTDNPWDAFGISESDYYNKPMWSWQKVTHSNLEDCKIEGTQKVESEENDYTQFWCYEVASYSGSTLGYMLKLEI